MLPLLFINGQNENAGILTIILSPYYWIFLVCYAILYYSHTYYVFPEWYSKRNYVVYAIPGCFSCIDFFHQFFR